ncbi:MAG: hypothetical protein O7F70_02900, partial [Gemmatimonadetes bacterium]|nr:hypothetical protein [Gemmatimonadota bacterium]
MTGAEFRAKYRLGKTLSAYGVRSQLALQTDGEAVMVHFLMDKLPDERQVLLRRIQDLSQEKRSLILDTLYVDDTIVVVSEHLPDFVTLEGWLGLPPPAPLGQAGPETRETALPTDAEEPTRTPPAAPKAPERHGEFTALFGALPDQPPAGRADTSGPAAPSAPGNDASSKDPGPSVSPPASDQLAAPAPQPPRPEEPGKVEPVSKKDPPGEFTQFFGAQEEA